MRQKRMSPRLIALGLLFCAAIAYSGQRLVAADNDCVAGSRQETACNIVAGFGGNKALPNVIGATLSGGGQPFFPNVVTGNFGSVGGGVDNSAAELATVAGGSHNTAGAFNAVVAGGTNNKAMTAYATIAGGTNNTASSIQATVGGGGDNTASSRDATIAGGSGNIASFTHATVGGGTYNAATGLSAIVAGGANNTSTGSYAAVGGGSANRSTSMGAAVAGGSGNQASGENSAVAGGLANRATGKYSTVGGGYGNRAGTPSDDEVQYATVSGGSENTASGYNATVPGGASNTAAGAYSVAAGRRASVLPPHNGAFVFADSTDAPFASQAANELAVRASGGVRLVTAIDAGGAPKAGVRLAPGGGAWESLSDRDAKANLAPVDGRGILTALVGIPITTWNYKTEDPSVRHIGPMAQDFHTLGVGEDSHYINTLDADGVAFAAIQGLYQVVQEKETHIQAQQKEIDALRSTEAKQETEIAELQTRLTELEHQTGNSQSAGAGAVGSNLSLLLAAGVCIFALAKKR